MPGRMFGSALGLLVCLSVAATAIAQPVIDEWRPIAVGVELTEGRRASPAQRATIVRVDLHAPGISLILSDDNGATEHETITSTVRAFAEREGTAVAVNASFFDPCCTYGSPVEVNIIGLAVAAGDVISTPATDPDSYAAAAFIVPAAGTPRFIADTALEGWGDAHLAVAGRPLLLRDGENLGAQAAAHPRTAIGLDAESRHLYIVTIDGRSLRTEGASQFDTAEWLVAVGATDGLNLDGGGSTTMVVRDESGTQRVINRLSHLGLQRSTASQLGVLATPLPIPSLETVTPDEASTVLPDGSVATTVESQTSTPPTSGASGSGGSSSSQQPVDTQSSVDLQPVRVGCACAAASRVNGDVELSALSPRNLLVIVAAWLLIGYKRRGRNLSASMTS